jgi:rod shape-determining protein MreC
MSVIPSRNRSLALLAGVLLAQVLLLAVQIRRESNVRLIRVWAVELISPIQRTGAWMISGIRDGWGGYVALRHARQENEGLNAELNQLKIQNAELESRAREADRLANLLHFRQAHAEVPMLAARVIGASPDSTSLILYIDRGSRNGIHRDMGVITPDGVVGKILAVYPDASQVLLLNDRESGVGAMLASTRTQGAVKGEGGPQLSMNYVSKEEKVSVGQAIVTSGEDRIFPKDLPVGTVVEARADRKSPFMQIVVKPAAHLDRLEEVLVLLTRQELNLTKQADANPSTTANPSTAAKQPAGAQ